MKRRNPLDLGQLPDPGKDTGVQTQAGISGLGPEYAVCAQVSNLPPAPQEGDESPVFPPRYPAFFSKRGKLSHDTKGKAVCCESTDIQLSLTPQGTSTGAQGTSCGGGVRDVQAGRRRYPCMQVVCPSYFDERLAWVSLCIRAPSSPVWRPTP